MAITGAVDAVESLIARRHSVGMTRERARAYARVTKTVRDLGPAKLHSSEQARIRSAADALLFCASIATDRSARTAFADVEALCAELVEAGRWSAQLADELADDVWACGPTVHVMLQAA
jgi:hypothetical protein